MGNLDTKAVLQKWIPTSLASVQWPMAYTMTLPQVQPLSGGVITQAQVDGIAADLLAIK